MLRGVSNPRLVRYRSKPGDRKHTEKRCERTGSRRSRAIGAFDIRFISIHPLYISGQKPEARSTSNHVVTCAIIYAMPCRFFSPICMVGCVLVRRAANFAKVPRPCFRVLAEGFRPEGEDTALEGMRHECQCKFRHGDKQCLRAETLQRAGARKGLQVF